MAKQKPTSLPSRTNSSVPAKASPNFTNRKGQPLPPGAVAASRAKAKTEQGSIAKVAPKSKPAPMPRVREKPGKRPTVPSRAPRSVPDRSGGTMPPGGALKYEKDYQRFVKKHRRQPLLPSS